MSRALAPGFLLLLVLSVPMAATTSARAESGEIHVYKRSDGIKLFTDQKKPQSGHVYIGTYGRPSAFSSCKNLKPGILKARSASYQPLVGKHASKHGVPAELVNAVMQVESCFDRRAVSRVGARGLMQLMPETAARLGVKDSFDPGQNIEGGARYLAQMRQRYPNDWNLVLAAYNAGPGAVEKYGGIPPYPETRNYVRRVMRLYQKAGAAPARFVAAKAGESLAP